MHPLTFIHISDTHLHHDPSYRNEANHIPSRPNVEAIVQQINDLPFPIDFVLHTGDIMHDPTAAAHYSVAQDVLGKLNHPVYYLAGNHDRTDWIQRVLLDRAETDITPHLNYQFESSGIQFVCLDSSVPGPAVHYGQLEEAQLDWLSELCRADDPRPLVVAVHHHALPLVAHWQDKIAIKNGEDFHNILLQARHRLRGVFYGHIHENVVTVRDGISYYSVLSGWYQLRTWHNQADVHLDPVYYPGFNVVTLTDQDTFVRHYRAQL